MSPLSSLSSPPSDIQTWVLPPACDDHYIYDPVSILLIVSRCCGGGDNSCQVTRCAVSLSQHFENLLSLLACCPGPECSLDTVFPLRDREWRQDLQQISACAARVTTCNFQTYLPQLLHAKFAKNHEKYIFTNLTNILRISFKLSLHNFPLSGCWVQNLAIYAATSDPVARSHQARHIKDNNNPEFCVTYHNISPVSQSINVTDLLHAPVCSLFQHTSKFLPLNYHLGLCNWVKLSQKLTEKSLVRHDPIPCLYWITRPG